MNPSRYIVSCHSAGGRRPHLRTILERSSDIVVLELDGPKAAVVEMTEDAANALRRRHPELAIELDVQHRPSKTS